MRNKASLAVGLVMAVGAASGAHAAMQPSGTLTVDQVAQSLVKGDSSNLLQEALSKAPTDITAGVFADEGGGGGGGVTA